VTLQQLDFFNSFPNVHAKNDTIGIVGPSGAVSITLSPSGIYTAQDLAENVNQHYPGVRCDYVDALNGFAFDFHGVEHTLLFPDDAAQLWGFSPYALRTGIFLGSDSSVDPTPVKAVCVKLLGTSQRGLLNMTTDTGGKVVQNPMLCIVPVTSDPYSWQSYVSVADDYFTFELSDTDVNQLRFLFTDRHGGLLLPMTESHMVLRIDTVGGKDETARGFASLAQRLDRLLEVQKMALLASYLTEEDTAP